MISESNSELLVLDLDHYDKVEFENFVPVLDKYEIKFIDSCFPDFTLNPENKRTIVALAKDLTEVKLNSSILQYPKETLQFLISK